MDQGVQDFLGQCLGPGRRRWGGLQIRLTGWALAGDGRAVGACPATHAGRVELGSYRWTRRRYAAARTRRSGSSSKWPMPMLQAPQMTPRILPVVWSWSI